MSFVVICHASPFFPFVPMQYHFKPFFTHVFTNTSETADTNAILSITSYTFLSSTYFLSDCNQISAQETSTYSEERKKRIL